MTTEQKIQVKFSSGSPYTYLWVGKEQIEIGDEVTCPGAYWMSRGSTQVGKVVALGSAYDGPLTRVAHKKVNP